ncbi:MAG: diaminopimelate decarboxylase [Fusobacterium sp. JB021]|nr:diaminopimelate decarboxylase [Fusobacterium sp. JB020]MDP0493142.1 diaminopimelate decarboxylase [Fusobacterium sp. JB021]MDP0507435.1 diaminopimelate decarboxylase [Fusobacterium sp. JB019]
MRYFGTMKNNNGMLEIGGISVKKLAQKYKTPLYIIDQQLVENNILNYKNNFKSNLFDTEIVYASKAFLSKGICQLLNKYNLSLDAVSAGELYTIKASNFPMNKVHMHGNNKTIEELNMCVDYNIGSVILDSIEEINLLGNICRAKNKTMDVMLRLNIGIDAHTHEYIKTSKHSSKFGESIFDNKIFDTIKKISDNEHLNLLGFHCHIGSQIFDTKAFLEGIEVMIKFLKKASKTLNINIPEINLGGGFGVYYTEEDTEIDIEKFMKEMIEHIEKISKEEKVTLDKVTIEPGRSIIGNAGSTLYSVGHTKETFSGLKYVFIDGGMSDNIRPALYQAKYEAVIANKLNDPLSETVTIAGKCCESGDLIIKNCALAKTDYNDLILVATTGAYGYSMSNNYNKLSRPAVIFVKDSKSQLSIKRETFEDLIKNDIPLETL